MNDARRKEIEKARSLIDDAKSILETCRDEEQEYYDNMPENMQDGDKGERAQSSISVLEDAITNLEDAASNIDAALD